MKDTYKGFELFNDITDANLRNRNRAVVLANLAEDNSRGKKVSPKGSALILGYFNEVPHEERNDVITRFKKTMNERGFVLA